MKRYKKVRIAIAQVNSKVGDLQGNLEKITSFLQRTEGFGVDIISFPEMALTGYPPEDLLLKPRFIKVNLEKLTALVRKVTSAVAVVGFVDRKKNKIYNSAAVIYQGKVLGVCHKMFLPNYSVFDEKRYFTPGENSPLFKIGEILFGVNICEDIWHPYGPLKKQAEAGAGLIININASPYYMGKLKERENVVIKQARENRVAISYANLVGGQDELVFDGQSMIVDSSGRIITRAEAFKEDLLIADVNIQVAAERRESKAAIITEPLPIKEKIELPLRNIRPLEKLEEVYQALVLGLKDYVRKNGFDKVLIGLSGGIDSSFVAVMAYDALGKDNVIGVFLPSRYSSSHSQLDAEQLAKNLGIKFLTISIEQVYRLYLMVLEKEFIGSERNVAEENLQARIRGNILMALSNKFGWLVLATGNKSEMSTGYATLYGDMAGGFAVIKDVPKTLVYRLVEYRNSLSFVVPQRIVIKEPTAELKPDQKDSDMLPEYRILDPILKAYVEEDKSFSEIIKMGFDRDIVRRVINMVDKSEYKRRQAPLGIKITPRAFGKDRRMPITSGWRG